MSDGEAGIGGGCEGLFWENQTWAELSNSGNSGGGVGGFEGNQVGEEKQQQQVETVMMGTDQDQVQAVKGKKRRAAAAGVTSKNRVSTDDQLGKEGKLGGAESDDHEMHIWTERERRKKMRNMFANLHALLPHLPAKADKSTIVDEAINTIKTLQQTLQNLQKQKLDRLQGASSSSAMNNYDPSSILNLQNVACDDSREAFLAAMVSSGYFATPENNASNSLSTPHFGRPIIFETWTSANVVLNICGNEAQINVCAPKKPGMFTTICYILENHNISVESAHISSDCNRSMLMIQARANGVPNHFVQRFTVQDILTRAVGEILMFVS